MGAIAVDDDDDPADEKAQPITPATDRDLEKLAERVRNYGASVSA